MTTPAERELLQSTVDEVEEKLVAMFINLIKKRRPIIIDKTLKEMEKAAIKSFDVPEYFLEESKSEKELENLMNNVIPLTPQITPKFELNSKNLNTYIHGWKALARYFGIHFRTLQRWNRELKIPWDKSHSSKNGRVKIHVVIADQYYNFLKQIRLVHEKNLSDGSSQ